MDTYITILIDAANEQIAVFRQQQQKFIYYTMALSVAGVGFLIHTSMNDPGSLIQLILLPAVLSLGASVFLSLVYLENLGGTVHLNADLLFIQAELGKKGNKEKYEQLLKVKKDMSDKSDRLFKNQKWLQYLGFSFLILWWITEIAAATFNSFACLT